MLGLPKSTEIKKVIPKSALFSKFSMNTLAREKFDADVKRITLVGEVSKNTIAINKGENVSSFFILLVSLKQEKYDEKNIILLSKMIDQNILLILEYENKAKLAIYHTKLMTSYWKPTDEYSITLSGLDLDAVWESRSGSTEHRKNASIVPTKSLPQFRAFFSRSTASIRPIRITDKENVMRMHMYREPMATKYTV